MQYRSTNAIQGFGHTGGALVVGVEAGSGFELNPASSGVAPIFTSAGDETNKGLTIQAKGTGTLTLGGSQNTVAIPSTGITLGGSSGSINLASTGITIGSAGTAFGSIQFATVQFTPPAMSSYSCVESTYAVSGLTTNSMIIAVTPRVAYSTAYVVHDARCSTAAELCVRWTNATNSTIGTGESTGRWTVAWITQ